VVSLRYAEPDMSKNASESLKIGGRIRQKLSIFVFCDVHIPLFTFYVFSTNIAQNSSIIRR
jgi:hypothetical protein